MHERGDEIGVFVPETNVGDLVVEEAVFASMARATNAMQQHGADHSRGPFVIVIAIGVPADGAVGVGNVAEPPPFRDCLKGDDAVALGRAVGLEMNQAEMAGEGGERPPCFLWVARMLPAAIGTHVGPPASSETR